MDIMYRTQGYRKQIVSGQAIHPTVKVVVTIQLCKWLKWMGVGGDVARPSRTKRRNSCPMCQKNGFSYVIFADHSCNCACTIIVLTTFIKRSPEEWSGHSYIACLVRVRPMALVHFYIIILNIKYYWIARWMYWHGMAYAYLSRSLKVLLELAKFYLNKLAKLALWEQARGGASYQD